MLGIISKSLKDQFAQSFTCPHDIGRTNCFVCTDQNNTRYAKLYSYFSDCKRTKYVVANSLNRIMFNHGNMLIGCSMVNNRRLKGPADFSQTFFIGNITKEGNNFCFDI